MANERTTLSMLSNHHRLGSSRATVREFDDEHLMQQVKYADVLHSETPSDFERWQMVGLTATPLKQDQDQSNQQQSKQGQGQQAGTGSDDGDWNHNQPQGDAAEAVMLYLNGQRSHPIGMCDDRRVRPYQVPEGATAVYAATGTGQLFYHNDDGSHVVVTNNPKYDNSGGGGGGTGGAGAGANIAKRDLSISARATGASGGQQQKERYASIRHVNKKPQDRNVGQGQNGSGGSSSNGGGQQQQYQHEGESINTEIRCTSSRIEFRVGDEVVGYYDKQNKRWSFTGEMRLGADDASHPVYGVNGGKGMTTEPSGPGAVLVKAPKPGPPTSQDAEP
jgi:phage gp45-like